jgi:hypothetical protein
MRGGVGEGEEEEYNLWLHVGSVFILIGVSFLGERVSGASAQAAHSFSIFWQFENLAARTDTTPHKGR